MKRFAFVAIVSLLVASPALAASKDPTSQLWEAFNLILLFSILVFLARKPVVAAMTDRRSDIEKNLVESERLLTEAQERLAEWDQKAAKLDAEVESIKESARKSAEFEAQQIIADARVSAERIQTGAQAVVDRELNSAQEKLRAEAADLAVDMAGQLLQQNVTTDDRNRLVDEFITKVETGGAH